MRPGLTPLDKVSLGFHAAVLATMGSLSLLHGLPLSPFLLNVGAIVAILLIAALAARTQHPAAAFLHDFHPLFFFLPIYEQVGVLNRIAVTREWDDVLRALDAGLFGTQPALAFSRVLPWEWLSEYMHFAYFTFYGLFPILGLTLAGKVHRAQRTRRLEPYLLALGIAFHTCNFLFLFLPARGPDLLPGADFHRGGYVFTPLMRFIYRFEIPGAFFPSSHVALTAVVLWYARHLGPRQWVFHVLGISLILSTVYCGYHYAVDALGGLVVAAAAIFAAEKWLRGTDLDRSEYLR